MFIPRLGLVSMFDGSGVAAFGGFLDRAHRPGTQVARSGPQPPPRAVLARTHPPGHPAVVAEVPGFDGAVPLARRRVDAG